MNKNFDLFYDVFMDSMTFIFKRTNERFFDLFYKTCENIIEQEIMQEYEKDEIGELEEIYNRLHGVDFDAEDIRKVLQILILQGFKEEQIKNGDLTPDTIGFLMSYLINKIQGNNDEISIFDPCCGSGNLLFSTVNHLENKVSLYASDNNDFMINLTRTCAALMDYQVDLFFQDSTLIPLSNMDYVICDINDYELKDRMYPHFIHSLITTQLKSLKDGGHLIALVDNNFFTLDETGEVRSDILESASILGILELPKTMFKENAKSLLILAKGKVKYKKMLVGSFKSFNEVKDLTETLKQIDEFFKEYKENK